jgi:hypothetical protein
MKNLTILLSVFILVSVTSCNEKAVDDAVVDSLVPKTINSYRDVNKDISYKLTLNNFYTNDLYAIKLTQHEFDSIANMDTNDSKMINFANSKGIFIDRGLIPIYVENEKMIMVTYKFDFGTILTIETINKELGEEIMLHYKSKTK